MREDLRLFNPFTTAMTYMVKFGDALYTKLVTNYTNFTVKTLNYDCDVPEGPFSLCS